MMAPRLKDIIDLEYLINMDDALLDSREALQARAVKDREIYTHCSLKGQTGQTILLTWLEFRRKEFFRDPDKKEALLPGSVFSSVYTGLVYASIVSGAMAGICLVVSFLAYHGTRPVNVAVFLSIFVVLQVILVLSTLVLLGRRALGTRNRKPRGRLSIIHTLLSSLVFNVLPRILKKTGRSFFQKQWDALIKLSSLVQIKHREFQAIFFWPFFILTALFGFSFSLGALSGLFFRVIVSDMAFGWQSTLMTTSAGVHDMVSLMALPWSGFLPQDLAHPTLEQIRGSRIILKDGISVLATRDLASWWPFLCMSTLVYAVIPRGILVLAGILAQARVLGQFNFERPGFRQVIARMQSPVLDIDDNEGPKTRAGTDTGPADHPPGNQDQTENNLPGRSPSGITPQKAVILASKRVYPDAVIQKIIPHAQAHLFADVRETIRIEFDLKKDSHAFARMDAGDADPVILLHEVWQPPIRGVLHYITRIRATMAREKSLFILLTRDPGQEDLSVDPDDMDYLVWKNAIRRLQDPGIQVKRFFKK